MKTNSRFTKKVTTILTWIFFFSGFAALLYQVVWQRALTLHYGVGAISMTLIISIYMVGLGFGSLIGGYLAEQMKNRLLLYFFIELFIGVFGLISLPLLNYLGNTTAGSSYFFSAVYMFIFLCIPTLLMGITLPLLTKIFNQIIRDFLSSVSYLYFVNTLGAAVGALLASYFIISFFGLDTGVYVAAGINFVLAILIFRIKTSTSTSEETKLTKIQSKSKISINRFAYVLVFITGFIAIGYEIVWFRVVGVLVKASPYVFSSVLAVYLFGIAFGSYYVNRYISKREIDRKNLFFLLQFLIGLYVLLNFIGFYYLTKYTALDTLTNVSFGWLAHPSFPSFQSIGEFFRSCFILIDIFFWSVIFVLIPTLFMGASFPLVSSIALKDPNQEGITVGRVYFFNIVGNVMGGFITGFVLLPILKTDFTVLLFIAIGLVFGLFVTSFGDKKTTIVQRVSIIIPLLVLCILVFPKFGKFYKVIHTNPGSQYKTYFEEDVDGVVATYTHQDKLVNYINGIPHGWRPLYEYHFETKEAVAHTQKLEKILVIGYGTGTIPEIILRLPHIEKLTTIELNTTLLKNLSKIEFYQKMFKHPKLDLIVDDGRRFLLRTNDKYDLILIDPLRSKTAYSNNLYSTEFFTLIKKHLNPEGVFMVWIDEHRIIPKTLLHTFNHIKQYRFLCLASQSSLKRNPNSETMIMNHLDAAEIDGIEQFKNSYLGGTSFVRKLTQNYPINRDWKPNCEYYIGLKVKKALFNYETTE